MDNKKFKELICVCGLFSVSAVFAAGIFSQDASVSTFTWRRVENRAFTVGERFQYTLRWGLMVVGYATIEVAGQEEVNGRMAYHIIARSNSYPFFDNIYKVRNIDESWMDVEGMCSLKYQKTQREGGYSRDELIFFDHANRKFNMIERVKGKQPVSKTGDIPAFVQDIISALYYVRLQQMDSRGEFFVDAHTGDKNYPLKVVVYGKERVKVPAGRYECFHVEPFVAQDTGIFRAKGRLWIWLTADSRRIPVLMKSKIFVGYITAELVEKN